MNAAAALVELYVYYKLAPSQADAARRAFEAAAGGAGRLLQREEPGTELLTWMEIYRGPEPQVTGLEALVALALTPFISGSRHLERFRPMSTGPTEP
ncbi:DUF4936 family protein [Paucibacter sp. AS339]|uniref:DUF4936 family protein n=1 Tax=Paucibacter hankyongi TaxID=3133434 RepID=UPI0030A64319